MSTKIDHLLLLPDEILLFILSKVNWSIRDLHTLSLTCSRFQALASDNTLQTGAISQKDLELPADVVQRHWDHKSGELNYKAMVITGEVMNKVLHFGLQPSTVTFTDCQLNLNLPNLPEPLRTLNLIRCSAEGGNVLRATSVVKRFWEQSFLYRYGRLQICRANNYDVFKACTRPIHRMWFNKRSHRSSGGQVKFRLEDLEFRVAESISIGQPGQRLKKSDFEGVRQYIQLLKNTYKRRMKASLLVADVTITYNDWDEGGCALEVVVTPHK